SPMNRAKSLSRRPTHLQTTSTRCGPADISAGPSYVYGPQVGAHDWMRSCLALHNQQKMIVNICGGASIWRGRLWKTVTNHSAHCVSMQMVRIYLPIAIGLLVEITPGIRNLPLLGVLPKIAPLNSATQPRYAPPVSIAPCVRLPMLWWGWGALCISP